ELPNTGPLEIIMAILVVAGICGGGYYFYRSRKNLNKVEKKAKGKKSPKEQSETKLKPEGENIAETTEPKPTDEIKK
ncbi:LPXTG cell wall anchor domain-containing protein, partial [Candidatus Saccharibacteria bacterium]|nr:LPXTG cell wall anchor domain-containing protein [Candidatus Saccharibacteria bacterium]